MAGKIDPDKMAEGAFLITMIGAFLYILVTFFFVIHPDLGEGEAQPVEGGSDG